MILDINSANLNKLTVLGTLRFDNESSPGVSISLTATYILVLGTLEIGNAQQPFQAHALINLISSGTKPDWVLAPGVNLGYNTLGVFGTVRIFGPTRTVMAPLAASIDAHSRDAAVGGQTDWRAGECVVLPRQVGSLGKPRRFAWPLTHLTMERQIPRVLSSAPPLSTHIEPGSLVPRLRRMSHSLIGLSWCKEKSMRHVLAAAFS